MPDTRLGIPDDVFAYSWVQSKRGDAFVMDGAIHRKERFSPRGLLVTQCGLEQRERGESVAVYRPENSFQRKFWLCEHCWGDNVLR